MATHQMTTDTTIRELKWKEEKKTETNFELLVCVRFDHQQTNVIRRELAFERNFTRAGVSRGKMIYVRHRR